MTRQTNMWIKWTLRPAVVLAVIAEVAVAGTIFVDDDAQYDPGPGDASISDPNEDGSATHPFDAIQEGIDAADPNSGDEVVILDGTYTGADNKDLDFGGKAIVVRSASGDASSCLIDCEGDGRGFYFHNDEGPFSVVEGLTITNGSDTSGGAMRCSAAGPTVINCVFALTSADYDGGAYVGYSSSPVFRNCTFTGSVATRHGGAMYNSGGAPMLISCHFRGNSAGFYGGGLYNVGSDATFTNCTFGGNQAADFGSAMYNDHSDPMVTHCTFRGNSAGGYGGALYNSNNSIPTLTNCVLRGNAPDEIYDAGTSGSIVTYSCVQGGSGALWFGEGCNDLDPLFAFPNDVHLLADSPVIDAGTDTPPGGLPTFDADGNPRRRDGDGDAVPVADMGAYEFDANSPAIALSSVALAFSATLGADNPADQVLSVRNCGGSTLGWAITDQPPWLTVLPESGASEGEVDDVTLSVDVSGLARGTYTATLRVADAAAVNSPRMVYVTLQVARALHVPAEYATLRSAIAAALPGDEVVLANGTYTGSGFKNLELDGKAITIRSASRDPSTCTIDCGGYGHAFDFDFYDDPDAIIEGLTITGANDWEGGAIRCHYNAPTIVNCILVANTGVAGGALYVYDARLTVSGCVFRNNSAEYGGAALRSTYGAITLDTCTFESNAAGTSGGGLSSSSSDVRITNCTFLRNSAVDNGGGVSSVDSDVRMINCAFRYNSAGNGGGGAHSATRDPVLANCTFYGNLARAGGALYNESSDATLTNCTLNSNVAITGGALCNNDSEPTLSNCVLWANSVGEIHDANGSSSTATHCCIDQGTGQPWFGAQCVDLDPHFASASDVHLTEGSPCIDTGTNAPPLGLPSQDIQGTSRMVDGDGDLLETVDMGAYEYNPGVSTISVTPVAFEFLATEGGVNPQDQWLSVGSGGGTVNWEISGQPAWLAVLPTSGTSTGAPNQVTLDVDASGLSRGLYTATLEVTDAQAVNSPHPLQVTLHVSSTAPLLVPSTYPTIQAAIDASASGDIIEVSDDTYTGIGNKNLDFGGKAVTVRSASGDPLLCIIDCQADGRGFQFHSGEGPDAIVQGLTITNGEADDDGADGIDCFNGSSPTLRRCRITNDSIYSVGVGIYVADSTPILEDCSISGWGCGMVNNRCNPALTRCTINGNGFYGDGGGVLNESSSPVLTNCTVLGNQGPGITYSGDSVAALVDCVVTNNDGGGVYCQYTQGGVIERCMIQDNANWGVAGGATAPHQIEIVDSTLSENEGAGLMLGGRATISNCDIAENSSYGLWCGSADLALQDCRVRANRLGGLVQMDGSTLNGTLTGCTFADHAWQSGVLISDGSMRLRECSFIDNSGGGMVATGATTLEACLFRNNGGTGYFGALQLGGGVGEVTNSIFIGNQGIYGAAVWASAHVTMTNCTIIGNTAVPPGSGVFGDADIRNCVIWWNHPTQVELYGGGPAPVSSLIQGEWDEWSSNLQYPMIASSGRLTAGSHLCFDFGDDSLLPADTFDLDHDGNTAEPIPFDIDGETRIAGASVDVGADEFADSDGDGLPDWWELRFAGDPNAADPNGDLDLDGLRNLDEYEDFSTDPFAAPLYVNQGNMDPNADGTALNPFPTIQQALAAAQSGDTVLVANATYSSAQDIPLDFLNKRVVVYAPDGAILSCSNDPNRAVPVNLESVRGTGSALVGFTIATDSIAAGGGLDMSSYSLFFRDCTIHKRFDCDYGDPVLRLSEGYIALGGVTLGDAGNGFCGGGEIERAWVHLDGDVVLENSHLDLRSAALFPNDLQNPSSTIDIGPTSLLTISGDELGAEPTVIYSSIVGRSDPNEPNVPYDPNDPWDPNDPNDPAARAYQLIVDRGQTLHLRGNSTVNMSPPGTRSECGDIPLDAGKILVAGTLECLDNCRIEGCVVVIENNDFANATEISNSLIILPETSRGFGGHLRVGDGAIGTVIRCNRIESDGDRYLSFDPDPYAFNRPTFADNKIYVRIKRGLGGGRATPLELRNEDVDPNEGGGASGAHMLPESSGDPNHGYGDPWVLEALEVMPGAAVVLTNRTGFDFNRQRSALPDALYVKKVILHRDAVLNTGLQRMYYQTLVDENGETLSRDSNEPTAPLANGSRIIDSPLLGFSVAVVHLDDDPSTEQADEAEIEFEARIRRRIEGPPNGERTCVGGDVTLLRAEQVRALLPDPNWTGGGLLEMRTAAPECTPAESVAAKAAFARVADETVTIDFDYLWRGEGELVVYASDSPTVSRCPDDPNFSTCHVPIGWLTPPPAGRPGSIGSDRFATFAVTISVGELGLDLTRGLYVELELRGPDARIWIDNWDPEIRCTLTCLDLSGDEAITALDFLLHMAELGSLLAPEHGCLDAPFASNHYVDLDDVLALDLMLSDPSQASFCQPPSPGTETGSPVDFQQWPREGMLIAGKPQGGGRGLQEDRLYSFDALQGLHAPQPPASFSAGPPHGNGRLIKGPYGVVYQIHATQGLIRLDTAERELAPFGQDVNGQTVYVGVQPTGDLYAYDIAGYPQGLPLLDVAFDRNDPNFVYVVPVVVESTANCPVYEGPCPYYRAAAQLHRDPNGDYEVTQVYGVEPAVDPCGNTDPPSASACQVQGQCEIEVDAAGRVLVLSASGHSAGNDWLMVYDAVSGAELERIVLTEVDARLVNPTTLIASRHTPDRIYLTSEVDAHAHDDQLELYRCELDLSAADPEDRLVVTCVPVQCHDVLPDDLGHGHLLLATGILEYPQDGKLYLLGTAQARVAADLGPGDAGYDELFCDTCPLPAQSWYAIVPPDANDAVVATAFSGEDLALPISAALFVAGDLNGDDRMDAADLAVFTECMGGPDTPSECARLVVHRAEADADDDLDLADLRVYQLPLIEHQYGPGDLNCDGEVNFADIDPFVLALVDPLEYVAMYPHCDIRLADANGDGAVDFADIDPFVALVIGD